MVEKESVRDGYDELAAAYADARSASEAEQEALAAFLDSISPDARVLDAGCGGGEPVLRRLADRPRRPVGVDFSAQQLEMARANAPGARLVRGDMTWLPVADVALDAVLAYHSLIHVPAGEHRAVAEEFARVLRPSGRLLVSEGPEEWAGANPDWLDAGTEMQWYIAGAETTRQQLSAAGFRIEHEYGTPNTPADNEDAHWVFFEAVSEST